jgi:pimeloyl-ACP methyl ester carboxylesterase
MRLPSGVTLAWRRDGEGPLPLVLLHGYSLTMATWDRVAGALPGCTVWRYDLRGCGGSGRAASYSIDDNADDLAGLIAGLGLRPPVIVGHSLGGTIAARFVVRHPGIAAALIFSDVRPPNAPLPDPVAGLVPERLAAYGSAETTLEVLKARIPAYFDPDRVTAAELAAMVAEAAGADRAALAGLLREMYLTAPQTEAELAPVRLPVQLIFGANDAMTPVALTPAFLRIWPMAETVVIPDCGHSPMWERPELWAEAVTGFLHRHLQA